jgi:predicted ATPase/class 3 adenylate cyclase
VAGSWRSGSPWWDTFAVAELPSGTVTFVFTDLEGSSRLWEEFPEAMHDALAVHDEILRSSVERHGGRVVKMRGDGVHAVFETADAAVVAAVAAQSALGQYPWGATGPLRVRIGIHSGSATLREGDYFGSAVNRAARLMDLAHGDQIVCSQATADLARDGLSGGMGLVDLGEHGLRDLTRAERVFQVSAPALASSFPALRSLESYATNLPVQMTEFVGREREVEETASALADSRVVTLTGVGGVGKTRLALQVAAEVLPAFSDGVFLVELGGINDATAIDKCIAAALLVVQQHGQTITESLLSFLGNKRLLVVLDNCEHLLEPVALLVSQMLSAAPGMKVLATSREALRIDGEQVFAVPSLAVPDDDADLGLLADADAVRLFVDRARATRSEFALSGENASAVAQLCQRLDGIPLAIELAAARVRSMTPSEIAARLDQRFRLLTGGIRTAASRHQTLRGAIDWSYDALVPLERALFGRLAVCVGGFDLAAAEAIGADEALDALDVDDALARLVDKSLVHAVDAGGSTRYKMLETIRDYAFERLDTSGETASIRTRHAAYYTEFAEEAGVGLKGPDERAWLERVEDELDNLRAAVMWSLASADSRSACRCVCALGLTGLRIEPVVAAWADAIVASDDADRDAEYPAALALAGWARMGEGRADEAVRLCEAALERLEQGRPAPLVVCRVMACLAGIEPQVGRNPEAHAREWLRAAQDARDGYEAALAHSIAAVGQYMAGEDQALATAEESLADAHRCGSPTAIAYSSFTAAMVYAEHDDPARALSLLDESQRAAEVTANTFAWIVATNLRNRLLSLAGEHTAAADGYLDGAREALRYGRREQQAAASVGFAASLAAKEENAPAAVVSGWVESMLGHIFLVGYDPGSDAGQALRRLPQELGDDYAPLHARGAAMTADEVIRYAEEHATPTAIPD